jgi:RNA polymerase sigma-70 factor (ECF subfamily)
MKSEIERINKREEKAWMVLFDYYYAPLCCYVEEFLRSKELAEDVVQEVIIKAWNSDYQFENDRNLTYYLYKAVYNNSISYLRTKHRHVELTEVVNKNWNDEEFAYTVKEELYRRLYAEIQKLPQRRRAIMMMTIEGKSGREIAELLGISVNTVKGAKQKAIETLRKNTRNNPLLLLLV